MATQHRIDTHTGTNGPLVDGRTEPQMGELIKQLASDGSTLLRNEIALAKLEMRDMAREIALDSAKIGGAIGLALAGALALAAAAVIALGNAFDGRYALAALIVGAVLLIVGGLLARGGIAGLKNAPRPEQTRETMRENKQWASHELKEFRQQIRS